MIVLDSTCTCISIQKKILELFINNFDLMLSAIFQEIVTFFKTKTPIFLEPKLFKNLQGKIHRGRIHANIITFENTFVRTKIIHSDFMM